MYGGNQGNPGQYPQGQQQGYPGQQQGGQYPQQGGQQGYPPQGQQFPQQGGYPGQQQGGYPQQQQGGYPQQQGGFQQQQGGYPQQQGGFQQQQHGAPQGGYGGQPQGGYGGAPSVPVVGQQYCLPQEQVFFLTEKLVSASGDDFDIVDAVNPSHRYQLKASSMSMSGSRVLKDAGGKAILNMKHKMMSGKLWYINRGTDDKDLIAEVKKPSSGSSGGRQSCEVYLKGNTSHHFSSSRPDLFVSGDVKGKAFMVYRGQQPIAEISRKLPEESSKQRITGKDAYALRVHPGQDAAFCIALVLVVDELYND